MQLSKEQFLKGGDARVYTTAKIESLGGDVRLGSLTAYAVLKLNELKKLKDKGEEVEHEILVLMLVDAVVDNDGNPMLTHEEGEMFLRRVGVEVVLDIQSKTPAGRTGAANPSPASP